MIKCGIDQWLDQRTHNPQVGGLNPSPATNLYLNEKIKFMKMREPLLASTYGSLSSITGMIAGVINYQGIFEAILLGAMGALGGLIMRWVWVKATKYIRAKCK